LSINHFLKFSVLPFINDQFPIYKWPNIHPISLTILDPDRYPDRYRYRYRHLSLSLSLPPLPLSAFCFLPFPFDLSPFAFRRSSFAFCLLPFAFWLLALGNGL
jgi:hypothetical protein